MTNPTCKKCLHHEHEKAEARKHFDLMSNEIVRLKSELLKKGDNYDLDNNLKPMPDVDCVSEREFWKYIGITFIVSIFAGFTIGFNF